MDKHIVDLYNQALNDYDEAIQKLERIKKVCKNYCEQMCLCESKETCEDCMNTEILQIISEVNR